MPLVKSKPKDVIRLPDVIVMFKKVNQLAGSGDPLIYNWVGTKGKNKGKKLSSKVWVNYWETVCLIAMLFLFGRRISEVITVKRKDVWTKRGFLYVRFRLLKRQHTGEIIYKVKRIHLEKSKMLSQLITGHVRRIPDGEAYIFQGESRPHIQVVRNKKYGKTYKYRHTTEGHMSRIHAYKILKALNPEFYPHYFRHSLATVLAEEHVDPIAIKQWFDWVRFETAMIYIKESGVITEGISNRQIG